MSQVEFLAKLQQGALLIADACAAYLERVAPVNKSGWNPSKIKWTEAEGPSGPYERSEDVNNLEFKAMLRDLASNNGRLRRDDWFYWIFKHGVTVGRKRKGKKKTGSNSHERMQ